MGLPMKRPAASGSAVERSADFVAVPGIPLTAVREARSYPPMLGDPEAEARRRAERKAFRIRRHEEMEAQKETGFQDERMAQFPPHRGDGPSEDAADVRKEPAEDGLSCRIAGTTIDARASSGTSQSSNAEAA